VPGCKTSEPHESDRVDGDELGLEAEKERRGWRAPGQAVQAAQGDGRLAEMRREVSSTPMWLDCLRYQAWETGIG